MMLPNTDVLVSAFLIGLGVNEDKSERRFSPTGRHGVWIQDWISTPKSKPSWDFLLENSQNLSLVCWIDMLVKYCVLHWPARYLRKSSWSCFSSETACSHCTAGMVLHVSYLPSKDLFIYFKNCWLIAKTKSCPNTQVQDRFCCSCQLWFNAVLCSPQPFSYLCLFFSND